MNAEIVINYPESLLDVLQESKQDFEKEARMSLGVKLFELGRLSYGMAAQLAGVTRTFFLLNLSRYNVPMILLDRDEMEHDIENA